MTNTRLVKIIAGFLGCALFLFGVLKFVDPFKGWFQVQINESGLPAAARWMGMAGEIAVGSVLISSLIFYKRLSAEIFRGVIYVCGTVVILIMATATYVHLQPSVPAEVLPMKIKTPYLPLFFAGLAILLAWLTRQLPESRTSIPD